MVVKRTRTGSMAAIADKAPKRAAKSPEAETAKKQKAAKPVALVRNKLATRVGEVYCFGSAVAGMIAFSKYKS